MDLILMLEDGTIFEGSSFGSANEVIGEIVFNTGMTGYQEILTDPSYYGQVVTMTYPLIGNYGINKFDYESSKPHVKGLIVREYCKYPSNFRCDKKISEYLEKYEIPGLYGIDTRKLTKILREKGTMRGIITQKEKFDFQANMDQLLTYEIKNAVESVTAREKTVYGDGKKHIALLDYGVKRNIIRELNKRGYQVTVFPADADLSDICQCHPDGIMLSNGPGDPKECKVQIENIRQFMGVYPIFAICLGHQLMALANNGDTEKLKYGHRGCNHPVKDIEKDRTFITSQNHGYTIVSDSIDLTEMEITHININDNTVEGVKFKHLPIFTVQFHPEACPGPQDTGYLFDQFGQMMDDFKKGAYDAKK
ncbi:MAG: carbamoyl phosphate synthase small subunit [Clostridia bacterium]|nr:carbamoyl phosphate synthase small subunit [Clostridia bacterium]